MPDSRPRIRRIFWRTAQVIAYTVLVAAVVFFGLTRTEVGRSGLRAQLEATFNDRFAGTLEIGALKGNLVNDLFASDVRILGPDGQAVVSVDSVVARPRWSPLLNGNLAIRSVALHGPHLALHRRADGTWNAAAAFRPLQPASGERRIDWALAEVSVENGRVTTTREGPPPPAVADGWLFDYASTEITDIGLQGTLEWGSEDGLVEVQSASLRVPGRDLRVASAQMQVVRSDDALAVNEVRLQTDASEVRLGVSLEARPGRSDRRLEVDLRPSRFDAAELRRLMPAYPLDGALTLSGAVHGTPSGLVIDSLAAAHGQSRVRAAGTVLGLPDSLDFDVALRRTRLSVADLKSVWPRARRLEATALGTVDVSANAQGVVDWTGPSGPTLALRADGTADSPAGAIAGTLDVERRAGRRLSYRAGLRVDSLGLAALGRLPAPVDRLDGTIRGRLRAAGEGTSLDSARASVDLRLAASRIGRQRLDSLRAGAEYANERLGLRLSLFQAGRGVLRADGSYDASGPQPAFTLSATGQALDLAAWGNGLPSTQLNATLRTAGRGGTWPQATGRLDLAVDSSTVRRGDSTLALPPHDVRLRVADRASSVPRLRLDGSLATVTVDGNAAVRPLGALGRLWRTAAASAVRAQADKPRPSTARAKPSRAKPSRAKPSRVPALGPPSGQAAADRPPGRTPSGKSASGKSASGKSASGPAARPGPSRPPASAGKFAGEAASAPPKAPGRARGASTALDSLRRAARAEVRAHGYASPLTVRGRVQVHQPAILRAWVPAVPRLTADFDARSTLTVSPDTMAVDVKVEAPAIGVGPTGYQRPSVSLRANASLGAPLVETFAVEMEARADSAQLRGYGLTRPAVRLAFADGTGSVRARADGDGTLGPFRIDLGLRAGPDYNEVVLEEVYAGVGPYAWENDGAAAVRVYRDAVVIPAFVMQSPRLQTDGMQRVRVEGTLSRTAADTLYLETRDVLLYPLSQLAQWSTPLGGIVNGRLAYTAGSEPGREAGRPQVSGRFDVRRLSFDRRLLGRLHLESRYVAGSPDLRVAASLQPEPAPIDTLRAEAVPLVPGSLARTEPNRLRVDGRIRLPGGPAAPADSADSAAAVPGDGPESPAGDRLDLRLDVERADLFFFEYIFEQEIERVRGYTTGTARISGSFTRPVFDADMEVVDGRFAMPRFGLDYRISGPVTVDRAGIRLDGVTVADEEGRATLNGAVLFNEYRYFSFDLRGQLDEISIIDVPESEDLPFYGSIRASGPVSLTGPLSDATLRSNAARTTPESELFIPVAETAVDEDSGYIIFADSTGQVPDLRDLTRRENILSDRPAGEPSFLEGLEMDINVFAPEESTVHLVFDPLVGDVVTAVGSARVQLQREEGEFFVYGNFDVGGGNYLFTAGEVFVRRFSIDEGTITWDGDPTNAQLRLDASYRTRASPAGLPGATEQQGRIPIIVRLDIAGRVETPRVDLSLALARDEREQLVGTETLDALLNQPEVATEYATSVLLTNTFLLTTSSAPQADGGVGGNDRLAAAGNQLAFNSVSQLVASQLNRYLSAALPNVDVNLGLQGEDPENLDIIYGVALRLLNERLIIRGEGVYTGDDARSPELQGPQGEFVVEVRLSRRVSVEVFYRRAGDSITQSTLTSTTGAGLSYQTEFTTWRRLFNRVFGWFLPDRGRPNAPPPDAPALRVARDSLPDAPPASDSARAGAPPTVSVGPASAGVDSATVDSVGADSVGADSVGVDSVGVDSVWTGVPARPGSRLRPAPLALPPLPVVGIAPKPAGPAGPARRTGGAVRRRRSGPSSPGAPARDAGDRDAGDREGGDREGERADPSP